MLRSGDEAQKAALGDLIDGSRIVALAHGEPDSHYELARVTTRAQRSGDAWQLNGAKAVVHHGEHASLFLVSARTSGDDDDEAGVTLFLVPRDAAGVSVRGYPRIDGGRAAEVTFDNVTLDATALPMSAPEPKTWTLLLAGMVTLFWLMRRKRA